MNASASQDDGWTRDFYWGAASSGYQSEGSAPDSNWKRFVDRIAGKDDVDPSGADRFRRQFEPPALERPPHH